MEPCKPFSCSSSAIARKVSRSSWLTYASHSQENRPGQSKYWTSLLWYRSKDEYVCSSEKLFGRTDLTQQVLLCDPQSAAAIWKSKNGRSYLPWQHLVLHLKVNSTHLFHCFLLVCHLLNINKLNINITLVSRHNMCWHVNDQSM